MFKAELSIDIESSIRMAYKIDETIMIYSRDLEDIISDLKNTESLKFYKILNEENVMVGYFGKEDYQVSCLTTFFIFPQYRKDKKDIWSFIASQMPNEFYSGLYDINTRAIRFFKESGGISINSIIVEDKPATIFKFKGE